MAGFPPDPLQAAWQRNISHNGARGEYQAVAAPTWVPDSAVAGCMVCSAKFSLTRRRHHCRRCGACVCDSCGRSRVPSSSLSGSRALDAQNEGSTRAAADELLVKGTYLEYVRVCSPCAKVIDVQLAQALRARGWRARNPPGGDVKEEPSSAAATLLPSAALPPAADEKLPSDDLGGKEIGEFV